LKTESAILLFQKGGGPGNASAMKGRLLANHAGSQVPPGKKCRRITQSLGPEFASFWSEIHPCGRGMLRKVMKNQDFLKK